MIVFSGEDLERVEASILNAELGFHAVLGERGAGGGGFVPVEAGENLVGPRGALLIFFHGGHGRKPFMIAALRAARSEAKLSPPAASR